VKIDDNNRAGRCCEKDPGRRRFLARLGVAVGSLIAAVAGLPSATPWAGVTGKTGAWVRRVGDSDFIAFVLNCSHLGCPVSWEASPKLFICPCHGSVYYEDGTVAAGPAPFPLQRFRVRVRDGQVELESRPIPITQATA
jgi:menaquinol-cytochrome c reductase iron-sulfur subunit